MVVNTVPSASQIASSRVHLERRAEWRTVRVDGVRYVKLPSGRSGALYTVRADGKGCSCKWYQQTGGTCAHMLAVREAANHDALDAWLSEPVEPMPADRPKVKPLLTYDQIVPACAQDGCNDLPEPRERYCWRHVLVDAF